MDIQSIPFVGRCYADILESGKKIMGQVWSENTFHKNFTM